MQIENEDEGRKREEMHSPMKMEDGEYVVGASVTSSSSHHRLTSRGEFGVVDDCF